ncbi:hypothetical protein M1293_00490 [Candidatus Parvarchaeota archaeon]|nr:hypothetical protein [Candidatus Parvarchaeota archaeon]
MSGSVKAQMSIDQIIAIILAIVAILFGLAIALYFSHGSNSLANSILNVLSFSWLFGHV